MKTRSDYHNAIIKEQNELIRGAKSKGLSPYLVHRAFKQGVLRVFIPPMDFYDDWLPDCYSSQLLFEEGYDASCLDPNNYPQILTMLQSGADKTALDEIQWP